MTQVQKIEMKRIETNTMRVWELVATAVWFVCGFFVLFSAIGVTLPYAFAAVPSVAAIVLFKLFGKKGRGKIIFFSTLAAFSVALLAVNAANILGSVAKFANAAIAAANGNLHWGLGSLQNSTTTAFADFALVAVVSVWVAVLCALLPDSAVLLLSLNVIGVLVIVSVGLFPNVICVFLYLLATVAKCVSLHKVNWHKTASFMALMAVIVVFIGASFAYKGSSAVASFRNGIGNVAQKVLYGSDNLPQGQLKKANKMLADEGERLYVTVDQATPNLYLKGFVGSSLEKTQWQPTDKNAYVTSQSQGLIKYLAGQNFPFGQYAQYLKLSGNSDTFTVQVENVGANSKYMYTPYSLYTVEGSANFDMNIYRGVFGSKTYSYQIAGADNTSERTVQEKWLTNDSNRTPQMKNYLELDSQYHNFVYENYLQLPEGYKQIILEKVSNEDESGTVFSISRLIRTWFLENFEYDPAPQAIKSDFFSEFFGGDIHTANAAYFATAATLIFRAYGMPARYVEGYLVRAGELQGTTTLLVTGKNSHAWTEVYFDGIGWLPVEVTLNFFTEADLDPEPNAPGTGAGSEVTPNVSPKPETPETTPEPSRPIIVPPPEGTTEHTLFKVMQVLVPILGAVLLVALVVLGFILNRMRVIAQKHRLLEGKNGEKYGCAVMRILDHECKSMGGYFQKKVTEELGIAEEDTRRFIELVERAVYGSYDLSVSEKEYMEGYVVRVGEALSSGQGTTHKLVCKYIKCIGM